MLTDLTVDELAGFPSGYTGKILGPSRIKGLSGFSLFALCGALGLTIALVDDPRARRRYVDRAPRKVRHAAPTVALDRLNDRQRRAIFGVVSWARLRREVLREVQRRAR